MLENTQIQKKQIKLYIRPLIKSQLEGEEKGYWEEFATLQEAKREIGFKYQQGWIDRKECSLLMVEAEKQGGLGGSGSLTLGALKKKVGRHV